MSTAAGFFAISLLAPSAFAAREPIRDFSVDVIEDLGRDLGRRRRPHPGTVEQP
jgi:hypothetical protein